MVVGSFGKLSFSRSAGQKSGIARGRVQRQTQGTAVCITRWITYTTRSKEFCKRKMLCRMQAKRVLIWCLWVQAAAVLRASASHLAGYGRVYKARGLLYVFVAGPNKHDTF